MTSSRTMRCAVCRRQLDRTTRRGSSLDDICNAAVNPYHPRYGNWEDRQAALSDLHARLRQGRPGWGRYASADLEGMMYRVYMEGPPEQ